MGRRRLPGMARVGSYLRFGDQPAPLSSRLSPLRPLGDYRLDLSGGAPPRLTLQTLGEAALILTGAGHWSGERLVFRGEAQAAPQREEALENLLNIIGRRQGPRSTITSG